MLEPLSPRLLFFGAYPPLSIGTRAISQEIAERLQAKGWTVGLTSTKRGRAFRALDLHATAWLRRNAYDVAHVDVFSGAAFRWAEGVTTLLRRLAKPYVLTLHGGNLPAFALARPADVARLLSRAAYVTAPSEYLLGLCRGQPCASVIPNALDLGRYHFLVRARPKPLLLWLRAFHAIYNPEMAIAVVRQLIQDYPELYLTMVGPDKDGRLAQLQHDVTTSGLSRHVQFAGAIPKSDVPSVLDTADVFLNTAAIDNSPVSVLEAMAAGLCVVSTNVGGLPQLLTHDHDALLVPAGDAGAMAAAIRRILNEPGLAAKLSRNARRTAEKHSWDRVLPLWEDLLSNVALQRTVRA